MKFFRGASHRALATAAAAIMQDEMEDKSKSGQQEPAGEDLKGRAPSGMEPKKAPIPADGVQLEGAEGKEDDVDGEAPGDLSGIGDGASVEPGSSQTPPEKQAAFDAGVAHMCGNIETVFASELVVGREALAAELLSCGLPSAKILSTLAKAPKGEANGMLASLKGQAQNPVLNNAGSEEPSTAQASSSVWGKVHKDLGYAKD